MKQFLVATTCVLALCAVAWADSQYVPCGAGTHQVQVDSSYGGGTGTIEGSGTGDTATVSGMGGNLDGTYTQDPNATGSKYRKRNGSDTGWICIVFYYDDNWWETPRFRIWVEPDNGQGHVLKKGSKTNGSGWQTGS